MVYSLREVESLPYANERFKFLCDNKDLHKYIDDKTGISWFRMDEIVKLLEYKDLNHAYAHLYEDDLGIVTYRDRLGRIGYDGDLISESGVYALINFSTTPEARKFNRWLFEVVLPNAHRSIRSGSFRNFVEPEKEVNTPVMDEAPKQQFAPKAEYVKPVEVADDFDVNQDSTAVLNISGDKLISLENLRKILNHFDLGIGYGQLCHFLRNDGYIDEDANLPSQKAITEGYMTKCKIVDNEGLMTISPMVTIRGVLRFIEKYYNLI